MTHLWWRTRNKLTSAATPATAAPATQEVEALADFAD